VLDTSAVIDGRVAGIVEAGFFPGRPIVPAFVLREIQSLADSSDPQRSERGRRALEVLDRIKRSRARPLDVPALDPSAPSVDEKLVLSAAAMGAALVTMDDNLSKLAELRGVEVLNVNALSLALRPSFLPGERRTVEIVREGREPEQGVAFLDDGSMIIVEDGRAHLGRTVTVEITGTLQRPTGRMYFARPNEDPDASGVADQNG
jgi:uncharacterized protein YacL